MSFSITITGHSSDPHNDAVLAVFEDAVRRLRALPNSSPLSASGYSGDASGEISFTADDVADAPVNPTPAAPPVEPAPAAAPVEPAPAWSDAPSVPAAEPVAPASDPAGTPAAPAESPDPAQPA